jgi:transcriptional repressor NrdR
MHCPFCQSTTTKVVDKRDNQETNVTRRRRECESCAKRFTTYERIEAINLYVIKRSGRVEEFDREKLKRGIQKAVGKRGITADQIEKVVQTIEQELLNHESTEIGSQEIGKMVLENLLEVDTLSYLIFASVYRNFKNLKDLKTAIEKLEKP